MVEEPWPATDVGRRDVLAGVVGVGAASAGIVPVPVKAASDAVLLGDFETGLDSWRATGDSLLETVPAAAHPGTVTRGDRGLEVTVTGDLLPTIRNEERVRRSDFAHHPYFVADVTPGRVVGTESDVTFKLRYYGGDDAVLETGDGYDLSGLTGVYESEETTVPPLVPSGITWDMSGLPDDALSNPKRLEVVWFPTDYPPSLDIDSLVGDVDYHGWAVFDNVRLSDGVGELSVARLQDVWRDLQLAHGAYLETDVTEGHEAYEEGEFLFADGAGVPYAFEVLGGGRYRYTIDGVALRLGGGW